MSARFDNAACIIHDLSVPSRISAWTPRIHFGIVFYASMCSCVWPAECEYRLTFGCDARMFGWKTRERESLFPFGIDGDTDGSFLKVQCSTNFTLCFAAVAGWISFNHVPCDYSNESKRVVRS